MEWKGKESAFTSAFSYVNSFKDYMRKERTIFSLLLYTLCALSFFSDFVCYLFRLMFAGVIVVVFSSLLLSNRSPYFCLLVCLFFIVAAHKSYRVSVTVATVKRTNSVQEYLTTIFITIQFSLSLVPMLLLVLAVWSLSRCSTFLISPYYSCLFSAYTFIQEFVLLVPDFFPHYFWSCCCYFVSCCCCCVFSVFKVTSLHLPCKRLPLLFIMYFLPNISHGALFLWVFCRLSMVYIYIVGCSPKQVSNWYSVSIA